MSSMDLDDLDGPSQAPARRPSRFLPKSSKTKPEPEPKPKPETLSKQEPVSKSEPEELHDAIVFSKKEEDTKPIKADTAPSTANGTAETAVEAKVDIGEAPIEDSMEIDEEEDQVVREIDVFFTPPSFDKNSQVYLLQYPLRPCWRPYEFEERCQEVRVKPTSAEVEVDLALDVDSKSYDADCASSVRMTMQTLSSSWKSPPSTGYAIGILQGNKLHLNPVHAVVQLRPSMEHLKSGGSKRKNNIAEDANVTVKSEEPNEKESVGSSKKQSKGMGDLKEQNIEDTECWVPLKYHGLKSDFSARYLQKMVAHGSSPIQFSTSPYDYVNSMCPGASSYNIKSGSLSKRYLLSLPLEERLKKYLCEGDAPMYRFNKIKYHAPNDSIGDVLGVLRQHALLVQGHWVPKSSLLFPEGQGVQALARDYVLHLFSQNPTVNNSQIEYPGGSLDKAIKGFLIHFAIERSTFKDWKFKEPTDVSFVKLYPNVVREQQVIWEGIEKKVKSATSGSGRSGLGVKNSPKPSMANKPGTSRNAEKGATKAANGTAMGRTTMSAETREALPKALERVLQEHKVCSFQMICQALRDLAVSTSTLPKADARMYVDAAYGVDAPPEELKAFISQVALNIHGVYVPKSSQHPEHNPLRKVVIDLLCAKGPNAKLKKADIIEAAKIALKREITLNEYNKVVSEICEFKGAAWVLKSGDGKPK